MKKNNNNKLEEFIQLLLCNILPSFYFAILYITMYI